MFRSVLSTAIVHLLCVAQISVAAARTGPQRVPAKPVTAPAVPAPEAQKPMEAAVGPKGPLSKRMVVDLADARAVIQFAEMRFLEDYFTGEISATGMENFEFDLTKIVEANVFIQFIENPKDFESWYHKNKLSLLKEFLTKYPRTDLQRFTAAVYLKFRLQAGVEDPTALMEWIARVTANPWIRDISAGTAILVVGVLGFVLKTAHGAMVAGPMAAFLNAFFEPLIRPIREKITIAGARLWEKGGLWLNSKLFSQGTEAEAANAKQEAGQARTKLSALQKMVDRLGYEMSPEQFYENLGRIHDMWNQVNQIWLKTQPVAYQNGRAIVTDALILRHEMFSRATLVSVHAAETHLQGTEQMIDRLMARSPAPAETESAGKGLERLIERKMIASERGPEEKAFVDKQINVLTEKLARNGATPEQIQRLISLYEKVYIFKRRAVTALASHMFHDVQYSEFNRELPRELRHASSNMRKNFGLDFFHREFAQEVKSMVEVLGLKIGIVEKIADGIETKEKQQENKQQDPKRIEDARAQDRLGELNRPPAQTPAEKAREAARRAGRR